MSYIPIDSGMSGHPGCTAIGGHKNKPELTAGDAVHRIASIYDTVSPGSQLLVIDRSMIGGDEDQIESGHRLAVPLDGFGAGPMRVFASRLDNGNIGIIVADFGAA